MARSLAIFYIFFPRPPRPSIGAPLFSSKEAFLDHRSHGRDLPNRSAANNERRRRHTGPLKRNLEYGKRARERLLQLPEARRRRGKGRPGAQRSKSMRPVPPPPPPRGWERFSRGQNPRNARASQAFQSSFFATSTPTTHPRSMLAALASFGCLHPPPCSLPLTYVSVYHFFF